jgi:O-antigen/teichoic acid export membrane protein
MSTARTVAKNTTALLVAEAISKATGVVYFAVLARYIEVEGVGRISTAQALVYTLIVIVSLGFDQLLTRDIASVKTRAASYGTNVACIKLALAVIYLFLLYPVTQLLGYSPEVVLLVYLYAANALLASFTEIAASIFRAFEKMEYTVVIRLCREVTNVVLSLLAIYLRYSLAAIVGISVFASFCQLLSAAWLLRRRFDLRAARVNLELCRKLLLACLPFAVIALYPLAQTRLNTLVLSATGSELDVGRFAAASMVIATLMLLAGTFMQATFPVFARFSGQAAGSLRIAYQKSFTYLLLLGLAVSVGVFLTADRILPLLLGASFVTAVAALKVLAWIPAFGFVGYCNGNFLCATGRERLFMYTEGGFTVFYAVLAVTLTSRFSYMGASYAMIIPTVLGFGFYTVLCHRLTGLKLPWRLLVAAVLAALLMAISVQASLRAGVNLLLVVVVIAPAVYGASLYLLKAIRRDDIALFKQVLRLA